MAANWSFRPPGWSPTAVPAVPSAGATGNERGVALQSRAEFRPPPAMTVELLLRIADVGEDREGAVCAAIATPPAAASAAS